MFERQPIIKMALAISTVESPEQEHSKICLHYSKSGLEESERHLVTLRVHDFPANYIQLTNYPRQICQSGKFHRYTSPNVKLRYTTEGENGRKTKIVECICE